LSIKGSRQASFENFFGITYNILTVTKKEKDLQTRVSKGYLCFERVSVKFSKPPFLELKIENE